MKKVIMYECSDGSTHHHESAAQAHDENLLCTALDKFLTSLNLDIGIATRRRSVIEAVKNQDNTLDMILIIVNILEHISGKID